MYDYIYKDKMNNGDFATWTSGVPDGWTLASGSITQETTDFYIKPNSLKIMSLADGSPGGSVSQTIVTDVNGKYRAKLWVEAIGSGVANVMFFADGQTKIYNFATNSWDSYSGGAPTSDQLYSISGAPTDSFGKYQIDIEVGAKTSIGLVVNATGTADTDGIIFGRVEFYKIGTITTTYTPITISGTNYLYDENSGTLLSGKIIDDQLESSKYITSVWEERYNEV